MKYEKFRAKVKNLPIIDIRYLKLAGEYDHTFKIQLQRWQKKGKVIKLKRGLYVLNSEDRKDNLSRLFISKELYGPSYVSLEYALSFYGLIPEKVVDISCVTTKKTMSFENAMGKFIYQHIKEKYFTGFSEQRDDSNFAYFIATPEKAVVDFLYLNQNRFSGDYKRVLLESFRFQNTDILDKTKMVNYTELFFSSKLEKIIKLLV